MHVRDPSVMHKYAKHQKTKCNLWARMWSSSSLLAEILIADGVREHLSDVSAIEIGAGMAVCALTAAVRGGAKIMVTDSSDHALDLVKGSARLNGVADSLSCSRMDWHSSSSVSGVAVQGGPYEFVIGSDILFASMNVQPIVKAIIELLAPGGLAVVIDPGRLSGEGFDEAVREAGLEAEVYEASDVAMSDGSVMRKGVLFLLTRSSDKDTERTAALKRGLVGTWGWVAENRAGAEAAAEGEGGFGYAYTHEWAAKTAGGRDRDIPPRAVR
mmetsp:Transcript_24752/g.57183  ORF Transcript_24752/g.57183 Transcript_24752/m.57183 type:complete len:271 (-) Transcript_24752:128-940(-)